MMMMMMMVMMMMMMTMMMMTTVDDSVLILRESRPPRRTVARRLDVQSSVSETFILLGSPALRSGCIVRAEITEMRNGLWHIFLWLLVSLFLKF